METPVFYLDKRGVDALVSILGQSKFIRHCSFERDIRGVIWSTLLVPIYIVMFAYINKAYGSEFNAFTISIVWLLCGFALSLASFMFVKHYYITINSCIQEAKKQVEDMIYDADITRQITQLTEE